jgi:putative endonuclease
VEEYEGFSARYYCDPLVWFEQHLEVTKAIARETQLKKWNRAKNITLIARMNPGWIDLSRDWFEYEPADYKRSLDQFEPAPRRKRATSGSSTPVGRSE